ncbi:PREDICTED: coiled-coil domain-containing protein 189-like isoform X2 [Branchiostoma belcheri]|uniref:Coiled-coil domain-containing protein 189-like isoform X2 n=1 Tax=Branchiostoma belcheri TaxID=7741 RepID=A0A6P4YD50_BRABE|nr:PREDICTED: coiled-coil domain-containing protein 189-like isoform X2 [Branchiostoma belcheri]
MSFFEVALANMPAATESTPGTKIIQPRRHKGRVVVWEDLSVNHMDAIDQATSADDLRSILGQIFGMSDHRDNLKNGVLMDLFVYTILYARRQNFNKEQTSAFFSIVKRTHGVCVETPFGNVQECYNYFTELLLCHGTKRPPFSVDLFDADQVRNITDYVVNTYFRHFKLYKYVFTPKVQLDLTMKYVGIPETPQPMEEEEQKEEEQPGPDAEAAEQQEEPQEEVPPTETENPPEETPEVESPRKKELRTLIQSQLASQVKELRMSVDEQLKINDQVLMQKLAALGEGDSSKGGRTSSRGGKRK